MLSWLSLGQFLSTHLQINPLTNCWHAFSTVKDAAYGFSVARGAFTFPKGAWTVLAGKKNPRFIAI